MKNEKRLYFVCDNSNDMVDWYVIIQVQWWEECARFLEKYIIWWVTELNLWTESLESFCEKKN